MDKNSQDKSVRLDKWLWAARFFKTRALAQKNISTGKVKYEGQKVTPSRKVQLDAKLTIPQGYDTIEIIVKVLSDQRKGYEDAKQLWEETPQSIAQREENKKERIKQKYQRVIPKPDKSPDKTARRKLREVKRHKDD